MPANDGVGLNQPGMRAPRRPGPSDQGPEQTILGVEEWAAAAPRIDGELLAEDEVLDQQVAPTTRRSSEQSEQQHQVHTYHRPPSVSDLQRSQSRIEFCRPRAFFERKRAPRMKFRLFQELMRHSRAVAKPSTTLLQRRKRPGRARGRGAALRCWPTFQSRLLRCAVGELMPGRESPDSIYLMSK